MEEDGNGELLESVKARHKNSKSSQTHNQPTVACGMQTMPKTLGFLAPQQGLPDESIVNDDVVEYADTSAASRTIDNESEEDYEEEEINVQVLAFGSRGTLSVPLKSSRSKTASSSRDAPASVLPAEFVTSEADVAQLQAEVKYYRKQLEDFKNGTALREKELHSIVESCRTAFEKDLKVKIAKADFDRATTLEGLNRTIRALQGTISDLEGKIAAKDVELANHEQTTIDAIREKSREWKLTEASLQMELQRMRGEREKIRFTAEVAEHRGRNNLVEAQTLAARAHEAEQRWFSQQRQAILHNMDSERLTLEISALEFLSSLHETCATAGRGVEEIAQHNRTQWAEVLTSATQDLLPGLGEDERAGLLESAFSGTNSNKVLLFNGSKVFGKLVDRIRLVQDAEAERRRFDEEDMGRKLRAFQSEVTQWHETLDDVRKAADTRLEKLAMRCSSVEKVSQRLAEKSDTFTKKRADHRAHSSVLSDLVEQHALESEEMSNEIKRLREENDLLRVTNKITEAEELRRKLQIAEATLKNSSQENAQLRVKVSTLEGTCETMDSGIRHHFATLEKAQHELATVRSRMEDREKELQRNLSDSKHQQDLHETEIAELRGLCAANSEQMKQQSQRIQFLERSIDSLKEKYLAEVAGQQSRQATAATGGESHSGSEVDGLREKVVVMRRQTDALSKKLDGALAEASHSEEVRLRTVTRCLAMMSAEDAAPRREQVILSEQMQLQREQKALEAREAEYLAKQSLLERKEMTLRRTSQPVRPTGGVLPSIANPGASTSGQLVVSASQELFGGVDSSSCGIVRRPSATSSAGSSAGSSAPHAAMKLAPLSQRPPSLTEPMVEHPQRLHS